MDECFKSGLVYLLAEDLCAARQLLQGLFPGAKVARGCEAEVGPGLRVKPVSALLGRKWLAGVRAPRVVYSENVTLGFLAGPELSSRSAVLKPLSEWLDELGVPAEQKRVRANVEAENALRVRQLALVNRLLLDGNAIADMPMKFATWETGFAGYEFYLTKEAADWPWYIKICSEADVVVYDDWCAGSEKMALGEVLAEALTVSKFVEKGYDR